MSGQQIPADDVVARIPNLVDRIARLNALQVDEIERLVTNLELASVAKKEDLRQTTVNSWPHAPLHQLFGKGTFIVTGSTMHKEHYFREASLLDFLEGELLGNAEKYRWQIEAWAVFSNHYHFVGHALEDAQTLKPFLSHVHANSSREVNERDGQSGRQVWFNYWETELTFEKSYFARLNYVHQNAVRHGLVPVANQYPWCSAAWFERTATPAQVKTIYGFKIDKVRVIDDFEVIAVG